MSLQNIFSTPIYTHIVPQHIADKVEEIITPKLPHLKFNEEMNTDFFDSPSISFQEIQPFIEYINKISLNYSKESNLYRGDKFQYWLQDYQSTHKHHPHCHPLSSISGTYYVRANENAGQLRFTSPILNLSKTTPPLNLDISQDFFHITPRKGLLILFPPWLLHEVLPSPEVNCIRTSFSFNYGP